MKNPSRIMLDLDNIIKDFRILAENLKDKYEIRIKKIYSQLNSHNLKDEDIINKMYRQSFHFFLKIFKDTLKMNSINMNLIGQEKIYQLIIEKANDLIAVQNDKFEYDYINEPVFKKILGYSINDLIGKTNLHLIHPDDLKRTILASSRILRKGKGIHRVRFKTKKGDFKWLEVTSRNFKDNKGEMKVLSILRDVTEHIKIEQELKESEEKFRTITEQSFVGIAILQDNIFKYINQRFIDLAGYSNEQLIGLKPREFLNFVYPDDREFVAKQASKKQQGLKNVIKNYQIRGIRGTGEIIWVEIFSKTINFKGRSADLITVLNITELKKAEELIIEENKKLIELDRLRKSFITRASHELRTPLTSICWASEFLLNHSQGLNEEDAKFLIESVYRGGKRLKELVKDLIDISKLEDGKLRLKKKKENIKIIIDNCLDQARFLIKERALSLDNNIHENICIEVDKIRIEQVINNILLNAIKNTPPRGKISVNLKSFKNYIEILIKDTGVGLTDQEKMKIFKKFGKIERYGNGLDVDTEGLGLGLYISKKIVELHNGNIWVKSRGRNKGSTFIIRVPK